MPISIIINQINVNNVSENATVTTGQNNQADWSWQGKNNMAAGTNNGINSMGGNLNILSDNDALDNPINNPNVVNPQPNIQY